MLIEKVLRWRWHALQPWKLGIAGNTMAGQCGLHVQPARLTPNGVSEVAVSELEAWSVC